MKKPDLDFIRRTAASLATDVAERFPDDQRLRPMLDAMLKELGVRTPYPPVTDAI